MNTKKIMGAFCALACAVNFGMITPAYAGIFGIMNAHQQEKWAEHLVKEEFNGTEPAGYSEDARRVNYPWLKATGLRATPKGFPQFA